MIYLLAHRLTEGTEALAIADGAFCGGEDLEETKKLIPNWNGYHVAGLTWSTSATLYWMAYRPCIAEFNSLEELETFLLDKKIIRAHAVYGGAQYTVVKKETPLKIVFDPKLIDEGIETAKPFWEK